MTPPPSYPFTYISLLHSRPLCQLPVTYFLDSPDTQPIYLLPHLFLSHTLTTWSYRNSTICILILEPNPWSHFLWPFSLISQSQPGSHQCCLLHRPIPCLLSPSFLLTLTWNSQNLLHAFPASKSPPSNPPAYSLRCCQRDLHIKNAYLVRFHSSFTSFNNLQGGVQTFHLSKQDTP